MVSRRRLILMLAICVAPCAMPAPPQTSLDDLAPYSDVVLDSEASSVAWVDGGHLAIAGRDGVRLYEIAGGKWSPLISAEPVPDGLPDPLAVRSDGKSVIANNGFLRSQYAIRLSDHKRLLARSSPNFMVIDTAIAEGNVYVLGWPADRFGAANPEGVAVWSGAVTPNFQKLLPLHRIQGGPASVAIFNDSLPIFGGALAVDRNGTIDVITAAEPGVFQYDAAGRQLRSLGSELGELVQPRMHDINFTYGSDSVARYRKVVNTQPSIDGLVATDDGPAIVVRIARHDAIEWELWYPSSARTRKRMKLGISRQGPFGHLSCSARARQLACVYQPTKSVADGLEQDPARLTTHLVLFKLPRVPDVNRLAAR